MYQIVLFLICRGDWKCFGIRQFYVEFCIFRIRFNFDAPPQGWCFSLELKVVYRHMEKVVNEGRYATNEERYETNKSCKTAWAK